MHESEKALADLSVALSVVRFEDKTDISVTYPDENRGLSAA